jgi:hypothetical protein
MAAIDPSIDSILKWCKFPDAANRIAIANDGFGSFHDIGILDHQDISDLAKGFSNRTNANGKITFGLKRTNRLKAVVDWTQDFARVSREPTLEGIEDEAAFYRVIEIAFERGKLRKHKMEDSDKLIAAASPGKLKKAWLPWLETFLNFLSCILGQNGVALTYVVRENFAPDYSEEGNIDFEKLAIACAPLSGAGYTADTEKVHRIILGFLQGEDSLTWIKDHMKKQDGRLDMQCLMNHYSGTGSKQVRINEAQAVEKNLVYKSERTLNFELFCTRLKAMFTAYAENGEPLLQTKKIRLLFEKIQHPNLEIIKNTLQVSYNQNPETVDYDFIVNSFATAIAALPEFTTRQASGVDSRNKDDASPTQGITGADGNIFTGFYNAFKSLTYDDQQAVFAERKRLGINSGSRNRRGGNSSGGNGRGGKGRKTSSVQIKSNNKEVKRLTKKIAALSTNVESMQKKKRTTAEVDDDDDVSDSAGNAFGGRNSKKNKN